LRVSTIAARYWALPLVLSFSPSALAAPASDTLLPNTTKGYVSVAKPTEFRERWEKTQLGQMWNDEVMQPFVESFKKQIEDEYNVFEDKLGLTYDDIKGVSSGELSLGLIEREGKNAVLVITMDVTDHAGEADKMLAAVEKRFASRGSTKETAKSGDTTLQVFTIPAEKGAAPQVTVYFTKDNVLVGIDDRAEAEAILKRFDGNAKDNLKSVAAYNATMERCKTEANDLEPEARWFVDPFPCVLAARTLRKSPPNRNEQDFAKILSENGFDAIQGVGGYVNQLVDGGIEILDRTSIYAPPVPGKENDPLRWNLSMRMLQLPNGNGFEPQSFVPRMSAGYTTLNLSLTDAFDNIGPLFDAVQEHEDAWKNTLEGWERDPYGPQVNVRKEFIENMGQRISIFTDYNTPITEESERSVFAIEAKDEAALAKTLDKWMSREPDVVRHVFGQFVVWERVPKTNAIEDLQVVAPGFSPVDSDGGGKGEEKEEERVLPNSAVTVALGHLLMASDVSYLKELLEGFGQRERLASSADYQQALEVADRLSPGERSLWSFGRYDEEIRPNFEMIRQNKMPLSKSILGKLLNRWLTTAQEKEDGTVRKQRIDGSELPEFEAVRRYFGPHGRTAHSEKDGWFTTGFLLNKEAP
jgi:hypothetical protein